jgi:hypothetical protein
MVVEETGTKDAYEGEEDYNCCGVHVSTSERLRITVDKHRMLCLSGLFGTVVCGHVSIEE